MKKRLAFLLAFALVVALFAALPTGAQAAKRATVYVTVNIDGATVLAAKPVTVKELTVDGALKAAHASYYKDGEKGYSAGTDSTFGIYMIRRCWGVDAIPYVILNGAPLGAGENTEVSANAAPITDGDNIIVSLARPAPPAPAPSVVSLTAKISGGSATLTAISWTLNTTSFTYTSSPLAKAKVVDDKGKALGTTDDKGKLVIKKTSGLVKIDGAAALVLGTDSSESDAATVNVTVNVDGATKISAVPVVLSLGKEDGKVDAVTTATAKPVSVSELTVDAALRAAHELYYEGGLEGYAAGLDSTWNMFLITECWGVSATPYVILNGAPLGAGENSGKYSADSCPVKNGDNIVVTISSGNGSASTDSIPIVSLLPFAAENETTLMALKWSFDSSTYSYGCVPYEGATVVDEAGAVLGVTDYNGNVTFGKTEGVVKIEGAAAVHLGEVVPVGGVAVERASVNVTVNIDGKTELLAKAVTVDDDLTVDGALRAAHEKFFSEGEDGYAAGVDPGWNIFMISKFWGVSATPYVILNGAPLGGGENAALTADKAKIKDGDNIIVTLSRPAPSMIASLTAESDGDKTDLTLTSWTLDFSTFSYNDAPFAGATLTDENGAVLGVTDENGCLTVKKTSGIAKLDGVAAISLGSEDKNEVRVTVNVDGATKILARPVTLEGEQTVEGVLKTAHELYYEGGPDGFAAGLDATWNMFLITKFWGVSATPYVILNGAPLGGGENAMLTADAASVAAGDNIIVTVFSPGYTQPSATAPDVVSLTAKVSNGKAKLTVKRWTLDFNSYSFSSVPYAGAEISDEAGNRLGVTDKDGSLTIGRTSGVVKIDGVAAYRFGTSTPKAVRTNQTIKFNGVQKTLDVYNINGSNYFKLRDLALLMNGTGSSFSVSYDEKLKAIRCARGEAYAPEGSELKIGADLSHTATLSSQSLYIDGKAVSITAYNLGGNNYFSLRELGGVLNFTVDYDSVTRTVMIRSK